MKIRTAAVVAVASLGLVLTGCGSKSAETSGSHASHSAQEQANLTIDRPWVKAVKKADGMTAVFGTIENKGSEDITITAGKSAAAGKVELHEVVSDGKGGTSMHEKEGGFTVPAGGKLELKPGGYHIMLMELTGDIKPGDDVTVTVTTSKGDFEIKAPAREFTGAKEEYKNGHGGHEGHDHKGHDHGHEGHDHEGHEDHK